MDNGYNGPRFGRGGFGRGRGRGNQNWRGRGNGNKRGNPQQNPRRPHYQHNPQYNNNPPYNDGNNQNNNQIDQESNQNRNQRGPRQRFMGFKYVQELLDKDDIDNVVLALSNDRNGFVKLLESDRVSEDLIVLIVKLLSKICDVTFDNSKVLVLQTALQSPFIDKLNKFITEIVSQTPREKSRNKYLWDDTDDFWKNLIKISREVHDLIPSVACEIIRKTLISVQINLPHIESTHSIHISDEIKVSIASLLEVVKKTSEDLERKREIKASGVADEEFEAPPNDFREIPVVPSVTEVTTFEKPYYRPNVVDRPYDSVYHYLDVQFRLLREDFVAPLRKGICSYIDNQRQNKKEKIQNVRIYKRVKFLNIETVNDQNCYKLKYDFGKSKRTFKYENSRRFMFGSLMCFTKDNFATLLFAKIVNRDLKLLELGQLIVGFNDDVVIDFEADYLMVESSVYFEPYYQVLNVLKKMQMDTFPMEKYIIKVEKDTNPPDYLLQIDPVFYLVEHKRFWPLAFPEEKFYGLNDSQFKAFKAALTQEFCIIQGPPGTGKTYLGLKIAHTLLNNKHAWYKKTPMLVICYTNTALDQFLEGLLQVTDKILRIGNQSKNEALNKYNIRNQRKRVDPAVHQKYREVRDCMADIKSISDCLQKIEENESVMDFVVFKGVVPNYEMSWFARKSNEDIKEWLLGGREAGAAYGLRNAMQQVQNGPNIELGNEQNLEEEVPGVEEDEPEDIEDLLDDRNLEIDDIFDNLHVATRKPLTSIANLKHTMGRLTDHLRSLAEQPDSLHKMIEEERIVVELNQLNDEYRYVQYRLQSLEFVPRQPPEFTDLRHPRNMNADSRWQLYFYWLHLYTVSLRVTMNLLGEKFKNIYRVYNEMRDIDNTQTMKEHLVVGMTTTGAARLQSSLQALKSPIVIVEEAAEVLEAHIVAALTNYCKHLILIGDHQQLKPSTASYNIETFGKLGISMFERMVINKIQCYSLDVQHRMRPEIARLVCPTIYPHLKDHETTLDRPHIQGIEHDLYFIDHQEPENECQDNSKKNVHEALFIISLARHLVLNGYKPESITILAAYLGQFFEMQREKKKHSLLLKDVRIAVLDNYQGEECDIILLSLVRSNAEKKIGFLKIENRVCVALSRARDGFYIIGNMSHLCQNSEIWPQVRNTLSDQNALGSHLTLRCQVHRTITHVSKADDFAKVIEGGCSLKCGAAISCGHNCKRLCHVQDREHLKHRCYEDCNRNLCNDPAHICKKKCYEECGPCTYPVLRDLQCGHQATIECHKNPDDHKCMQLVSTKLPCDHVADKPCSADAVTFRCPRPCDSRVEPCGHSCEKQCHIRFDPDHLKYHCKKDCEKPRIGCKDPENPAHKCPRMCFQNCDECEIGVKKMRSCGHMETIACKTDIEQIDCQKPCKKMLPCGHKCKSKCYEECAPCNFVVEKTVPICNHTIKIKCHQQPDRSMCRGKCPRPLPCGHKCTKRCNQECTSKCKEIVDCNLHSPCGHNIRLIQCHLKSTTDGSTLMANCTQRCEVQLKCGDVCTGTCGQCIQGRIHKRCTEKCGRILVCNHECPLPCRQACKPCEKPCQYKCLHSQCKKKCGEPCSKCKENCLRRCAHQRCTKKCGDICDVPPCTEKCPKKLTCGHDCVGFCGDPCPKLCRICNKDELEEIFFGTEDDQDAVFVYLKDCEHVMESTGLEHWMEQNSNEVQIKVCPKCKAPILTTERFSDYVKRAMQDVVNIKTKEFGAWKVNDNLRNQLLGDVDHLREETTYLRPFCPDLTRVLDTLKQRLLPVKKDRRQPINTIELKAVKSKIQILEYIIRCFDPLLTDSIMSESLTQMSLLLKVVIQDEDAITTQEIEDIECEINRLKRIIQLDQLRSNKNYKCALTSHPEIRHVLSNVVELINTTSKFTDTIDNALYINLKELGKKIDESIAITDRERREIVAALSVKPVQWYKCPNGHYYAIGDCGRANQVAKCTDCNATIGGQQHILQSGNRPAPEMTASSWPGVHM